MKFIKLTKIEGADIAVNVNHIVAVEVYGEESTWIELVNGNKFLVSELAEDVLESLKAELV